MMLVITPIFVTTSLWRVITPSLWQRVRLEPFTLHDTGKSLCVWVKLLPIGPKVHMQKGYYVTHYSLLPMGGRGKSLSVWVRLGKIKRPHAKEILYGTLSPTAHGGIGISLRVWVRLSRANISHAKRGTFMLVVCGFWLVFMVVQYLWHLHLCGGLSYGLGWLFSFLEKCCYAHNIYIM